MNSIPEMDNLSKHYVSQNLTEWYLWENTISSTSAPLVKVNQHIWSINSDRVNLVTPASPVPKARYSTNWDRKAWPGSEIKMYYGCPWFICELLDVTSNLISFDNFDYQEYYFNLSFIKICLHTIHLVIIFAFIYCTFIVYEINFL